MTETMEQPRVADPDNIQALMREIREGDREAFMTVVRTYQQRVFATAYTILRNREDSLDIVQETFLRLYQKAGQYKEGSSFQAWLLQIARNLCVDHYRRNIRKRKELESSKTLDELQPAAPPDPASSPAAELKDAMTQCIDKLANRQREVFVLRHVDELQFNEISQTLNISVGTVKSLHFKAVRNMKKWLAPYMGMQT
jgi:RNA polymerase sigma-70 factor, ECF subfamily